jgi:hypothetical protein
MSDKDMIALQEAVKGLDKAVNDLSRRIGALEKADTTARTKVSVVELPNDIAEDEVIVWKRVSGGTLRLSTGKIIKPGQTFSASINQLPRLEVKAKRVIPVSGDMPQKKEEVVVPQNGYEIIPKSGGWFDVVNSQTRKAVNEKSLREEEAKKLLADLS